MSRRVSPRRMGARLALIGIATAGFGGTQVLAQPVTTAEQPPRITVVEKKTAKERMVCKTREITGSRLHVEKVCMNRSDWSALQEETRKGMADWSGDNGTARRDVSCMSQTNRTAQC